MSRVVLAFILACAIGTGLALMPLLSEGVAANSVVALAAYSFIGVLPAAVVLGGPVLLLLWRIGLLAIWHFLLAGALVWFIGVTAAAVIGAMSSDALAVGSSLLAVLAGFATFWLVAVRPRAVSGKTHE